jgi:limonene-1,2-epoxide hydrolase
MALSTPSTTNKSAIQVVESFLAAMEALDMARVVEHLAPDVVYQNVPLPAAHGKDAVVKTLRGFERVMTGFEVKMHNIAERNGVVLTERTDILKGPLLYLDIRVNGTFEVRDGKIVLWRDYADMGETLLKLLVGPVRRFLHR